MGLCRLPLLHRDHCGFIRPQNPGPVMKYKIIYHNANFFLFHLQIYKSMFEKMLQQLHTTATGTIR